MQVIVFVGSENKCYIINIFSNVFKISNRTRCVPVDSRIARTRFVSQQPAIRDQRLQIFASSPEPDQHPIGQQ